MNKLLYLLIVLSYLSCEAIFIQDISSSPVLILAPTEGSSVSSGNISFRWKPVEEVSSYNIQIASPNFQNANQVLTDSITLENLYQRSLDAGEYQWRVKGINSEYETDYTTVSFTVN